MSQPSQRIWIDADACPRDVKELVSRAGERRRLGVVMVANALHRVSAAPRRSQ
jgi:uncharacterized protein